MPRQCTRPARSSRLLLVVGLAACTITGLAIDPTAAQTVPPASQSSSSMPGSSSTASTRPATPSTEAVERARDAGDPISLAPSSVLIRDDPRSSPRLASVRVESAGYTAAVANYHRSIQEYQSALDLVPRAEAAIGVTIDRQHGAMDRFNGRVTELGDLITARNRLRGELNSATRRRDKGDASLSAIRAGLRDMAVNEYMAGGFGGAPEGIFDFQNTNQLESRKVMIGLVKRDRMVELQSIKAFRDDNEQLVTDRQSELEEITRRVTETEAARDQAARDRETAVADEQRARRDKAEAEATVIERRATVDARREDVADERTRSYVPEIGLPFVVLNAYAKAADRFAQEQPSCGIRWTALAGIGRTESNHGTFGGAEVDSEGNETKPIFGIPLDGSNGTANIGDTDGGALDADSGTDRAMGPMQFIPSTWRTLGLDGNDDGRSEPQNYYDAALSAANLLCRKGPGLDTDEGLRRAFRSYNNDGHYVETVLERTHGYDRFVIPAPDAAPDPTREVPGLSG